MYAAIHVLADFRQANRAASVEPIAAFETQRKTDVEQLEQREIAARLGHSALNDVENFFTAERFTVKCHEQRAPCPTTL
jgi:hypothetical protein